MLTVSDTTYIEFYNTEIIADKFSNAWQGILEIFKETKHAYNDEFFNNFFVTIVYQDGTREEIE